LDEFQEVRDFMEHGKLKGGRDVESVIEDKLAKVSRAVSEKVPDDVKRAAKDAANNIIKTVDKAGKEISKNVSELASQADGATRRVAKEAAAAGVATQDSLQRLWRKTKSHAEDLLNKVDDVKHKEVAGWTPLPSHKEIVIPPIGTMLLGWASLLGVQSIFSLPQYRQPIERLVGGKTVFNVLGGSVCGAIAGALGYYWHKEGQFLGPNINHAVPEVFTDALKALAIVGASQSLVNYAPSINDLVSGKVSLFDDGQETGAKRISRHVLLYSLGAFGLAHALEKRNLGNWLFWGLMPVYATVAGYLNVRLPCLQKRKLTSD